MEAIISVIVPVYNVEEFLPRCIESIINQTYTNLDIILINDGSTDGSGEICNRYQLLDGRITVIHQENKGVCRARKTGIKIAKGKYIGFVDPDDWIEADMYAYMVAKLIQYKVNIVTCNTLLEYEHTENNLKKGVKKIGYIEEGVYRRDGKGKGYSYKQFYRINKEQMPMITISMWDKLFEKNVIDKYYMNIPDDLKVGEDMACIAACIPFVDAVYICDKGFYHYNRYNWESATRIENWNYILNIINVYKILKEDYLKHEDNTFLLKELYNLFIEKLFIRMPINIPYHFPVDKISIEGSIIIYGMGKVGKSYIKQFGRIADINKIIAIDKNKVGERVEGIRVRGVEAIGQLKYDLVIIAISDKGLAESIKKELQENYGVDLDKVIWENPIHVIDMIV